MIKADFHTHTYYCDGKNSPAEMAESAYKKGLSFLGISGHSHTDFEDYCMSAENTAKYVSEINQLKIQYNDKVTVLLGSERDYYGMDDGFKYDYLIGSVHYIKCSGEYLPVDLSSEAAERNINEFFGGDQYKYAEAYYELEGRIFERVDADIIGHIDLLTKFEEQKQHFDTSNPRYVNAWKTAIFELIKYNKPFELNSGAMSRGYRFTPYPSSDILKFIKENGGHIMLNSDSHSAENICFAYDAERALAISNGFKSSLILTGNGFEEIPLL